MPKGTPAASRRRTIWQRCRTFACPVQGKGARSRRAQCGVRAVDTDPADLPRANSLELELGGSHDARERIATPTAAPPSARERAAARRTFLQNRSTSFPSSRDFRSLAASCHKMSRSVMSAPRFFLFEQPGSHSASAIGRRLSVANREVPPGTSRLATNTSTQAPHPDPQGSRCVASHRPRGSPLGLSELSSSMSPQEPPRGSNGP